MLVIASRRSWFVRCNDPIFFHEDRAIVVRVRQCNQHTDLTFVEVEHARSQPHLFPLPGNGRSLECQHERPSRVELKVKSQLYFNHI